MPIICRFLGIIITVYYKEHGVPHFHAKYGEFGAVIAIETLKLIKGELPKRVLNLVVEWAFEHRDELLINWKLAREEEPLNLINPLT